MPSKHEPGFNNDTVKRRYQKVAGPYFDELVGNYDLTRDYLKHADPRARLAALLILRDYWKPPADFAELCEKMALEDTDLNVRCCALNGLIVCYGRSNCGKNPNARMGRWLANHVRDETQPSLFRKLAYFILFALCSGRDCPDMTKLRFPEEVDWNFVSSFFDVKV